MGSQGTAPCAVNSRASWSNALSNASKQRGSPVAHTAQWDKTLAFLDGIVLTLQAKLCQNHVCALQAAIQQEKTVVKVLIPGFSLSTSGGRPSLSNRPSNSSQSPTKE
jgi:hypothetical protein